MLNVVARAVLGHTKAATVLFLSAILLITAAYSYRTIQRNEGGQLELDFRHKTFIRLFCVVDWASDRALFKSAVEVFPGNCKMHHNYATTLSDETVRYVLMCA